MTSTLTQNIKRPSRFFAQKLATLESFADFYEGKRVPEFPLEVYLETTNQCNLRCAMCVTFSGINPERNDRLKSVSREFLNYDALLSSLDPILARALVVHCYGFGEPTLHPEFGKIVEHVAQYEVQLDFITNGTHLTEELCQLLVDNRVFEVFVSFSGSTADEYENVYLGSKFDAVLAGMKRLADAKLRANSPWPRIRIQSVAFNHHIQGLDRFVNLMADHGAATVVVTPLLVDAAIPHLIHHAAIYEPSVHDPVLAKAFAAAKERGVSLLLDPWIQRKATSEAEVEMIKEQAVQPSPMSSPAGPESFRKVPLMQFQDLARKTRQRPAPRVEHEHADPIDVKSDSIADAVGKLRIGGERRNIHCMNPFSTLYIDALNRVKPCCYANLGTGLGDVAHASAEEIWNGPGYQAMRTSILSGYYPTMCDGCLNGGFMPRMMTHPTFADNFAHWFNSSFEPMIDPAIPKRLWARDEASVDKAIGNMIRHRPDLRQSNVEWRTANGESKDPIRHPTFAIQHSAVESDGLEFVERSLAGHDSLPNDALMIWDGWVDGVQEGWLVGWAFSHLLPDLRLPVRVLFDGQEVYRATANGYRADLQKAGKNDGFCCFRVSLAELPPLRGVKEISVMVGSTNCRLGNSPITVEAHEPLDDAVQFTREILAHLRGQQIDDSTRDWIDGRLEGVVGDRLNGWIFSPRHPQLHVPFRILFDGVEVHAGEARRLRPDVPALAAGDGRHGFSVALKNLPDLAVVREISVTVGSTTCTLPSAVPEPLVQ